MFSTDHSTTTLVDTPQKSPKALWGVGCEISIGWMPFP